MFEQSKIWMKDCVQKAYSYLDSGFQGVNKYLKNALIPFKKTKFKPLTDDQKWFNKELSKVRIKIEHINRHCKIFKVCKLQRRQKQRHFNLFWTVIAGIINFKLNY
jgi:hypothetical protein